MVATATRLERRGTWTRAKYPTLLIDKVRFSRFFILKHLDGFHWFVFFLPLQMYCECTYEWVLWLFWWGSSNFPFSKMDAEEHSQRTSHVITFCSTIRKCHVNFGWRNGRLVQLTPDEFSLKSVPANIAFLILDARWLKSRSLGGNGRYFAHSHLLQCSANGALVLWIPFRPESWPSFSHLLANDRRPKQLVKPEGGNPEIEVTVAWGWVNTQYLY